MLVENDPRWSRLVAGDKSVDGGFFYSVATTGVYCRPSCGARAPNPKNVRFHASAAEAEAEGFRACRRCRPDLARADLGRTEMIARICRMIEEAEENLSLAALAGAAGLSPDHFHRVFKAATGVTPRDYAAAQRARRVRARLAEGAGVTEAIFDAGFGASSRFYEASRGILGMKATEFRAGGRDQTIFFAVGQCSLGAILVARSEVGVCAILLGDAPEVLLRELQDRFPRARLEGGDAGFEQLVAQVVGVVENPALGAELPLDVRGTAFQRRVWQALRRIPAGTTASYGSIAREIGAPRAVRAVAQACAANALAVAIPCHRVVRRDGDLAGYRWGIERKRALLERER